MQTLKFITAGNVDDGKSTLIGRLLYDSDSISTDHLGVLLSQSEIGHDSIDLAKITDGLRAEREQGITIDVAYKYFATKTRKFIIADSPGHQQYTKNMITGASVSDLIIILIDVRKGITEQTKRHACIANLMGIKKVIVAVNKMDLVEYESKDFYQIKQQFELLSKEFDFDQIIYIPISALHGDNIVNTSEAMPWFKSNSLLQELNQVEIQNQDQNQSRFQVQLVIRPQTPQYIDYRGYAGLVLSGRYQKGDQVIILPSKIKAKITRIEKNLQQVDSASAGDNVVLHFDSDIDISRGDMIYIENQNPPSSNTRLKSWISWLDSEALQLGKTYLLQHRFHQVRVKINQIDTKLDINNLNFLQADELKLNDIAQVSLQSNQSLHYDSFSKNPKTGNAILIDETTFNTVGALMFM